MLIFIFGHDCRVGAFFPPFDPMPAPRMGSFPLKLLINFRPWVELRSHQMMCAVGAKKKAGALGRPAFLHLGARWWLAGFLEGDAEIPDPEEVTFFCVEALWDDRSRG